MRQDHPMPMSDKLKTTLLAFVGFLVVEILLIYAFGYIVNIVGYTTSSMKVVMTTAGLTNLPIWTILFAAAVTVAELPAFSLERTLRGALAGFLFVLSPIILNLNFLQNSQDISTYTGPPTYLLIIAFAASGVLAALAIDLPYFKLSRISFFVMTGWVSIGIWALPLNPYQTTGNLIITLHWLDTLQKAIFLSLGYGLIPRGSGAQQRDLSRLTWDKLKTTILTSDKLKTTILAFVSYLVLAGLLQFAIDRYSISLFGPFASSMWSMIGSSMYSLEYFLLQYPVLFAATVTIAELPAFRLERSLRGALAGFLFVFALLPATMPDQILYSHQEGTILWIVASAVLGVLAALAIDLPRFRLSRIFFFVSAQWLTIAIEFYQFYDPFMWDPADITLLQAVFLSLGYGLIPRGSSAQSKRDAA